MNLSLSNFNFLYSSIIKPISSKLSGKALSKYLHKKLWNTFSFFIYLVRVSLLIVKSNSLKYSIQDVKEQKFRVWPQESVNVFPSLISNSTETLLEYLIYTYLVFLFALYLLILVQKYCLLKQ